MTCIELAREMDATPELIKLLMALENDDVKSKSADVAYMPGLSEGMVEAGDLFSHFTHLFVGGKVRRLAISGSDGRGWGEERDYPTAAWPGVVWYMDELAKRAIPREFVVPITRGPQRNSLQETEALLLQADAFDWRRIVVVSVDYHRARQALGIVQQINTLLRAKKIRVRPIVYFPSFRFRWNAPMLGSQNARMSTGRQEAALDWLTKIPQYQAKGDLASFSEVQLYIKWRDSK